MQTGRTSSRLTFASADYEAFIRSPKVRPDQAVAARVAKELVHKLPGVEVDVLGLPVALVDQYMCGILADAHGRWRCEERHLILQLPGHGVVDVYLLVVIYGHKPPPVR